MEFGKVSPHEVLNTNFTLPPDGAQTSLVLKGKAVENAKFYVGCAKWGRKEWVGFVYPPKTREKDFLSEYAKQFNTVELNTLFYGIPKGEQVAKWRELAIKRPDFVFCPKFPKIISHIKRLNKAAIETDLYLRSIANFEDKLGPCFLQLSDSFSPNQLNELREYLIGLPKDLDFFVEVRHTGWFKEPAQQQLFEMLAELKVGAVITDTTGRRDVLHMQVTVPKVFIRFVGNGGAFLDISDKNRVDGWVNKLADWLDRGLEEIYFFLHQPNEIDTLVIADYTIERFNKILGSDLPPVRFIPKQTGLF